MHRNISVMKKEAFWLSILWVLLALLLAGPVETSRADDDWDRPDYEYREESEEAPGKARGESSHHGRFEIYEGTQTCLACHEEEAAQVHGSVHYQWQGDASEALGLDTPVAGKLGGINDFCIYPDINWIGKLTTVDGAQVDGGCAKCHAGLGQKPTAEPTAAQLANIDCLVCHADDYKRTVSRVDGAFRFVPDTAKMAVSITEAALNVGRPSNDSCLNCHTKAGGGNNFKRGDIEEAHRDATAEFDVHLASKARGGAGLTCLDCHTTTDHRMAGRGSDLRPRESAEPVNCTNCHGATPHDQRDIDKHTARVNCTVCHIPEFAKVAPTDMNRDWSQPGDLVATKGLYEPHHEKGTRVQPEYRFYNGTSWFYQFGATAIPGENGRIAMSEPDGDILDPNAKIFAFKRHLATQPIDPLTRRLLPLKIGKFFETGVIDQAVALGVEAVGWDYNGHEFAQTERFMGLFHEVAPKNEALSCRDCHGDGNRIDFQKLGYTPKASADGQPLCGSCHDLDEAEEWQRGKFADFKAYHKKHIKDEKTDCQACHIFTAAR